MARSIDLEPEQEEDGTAEIWDSDRVANATGTETAEYITDKINDYSQRGLRGVDLFTYWRSDFGHFTSAAYKRTTTKTKLLRDYLLENSVFIPKDRRPIADNLIDSAKAWTA